MYHKNFKLLPWTENIEVARPTIGGFYTQKNHFFRVYLKKTDKDFRNRKMAVLDEFLKNLPVQFVTLLCLVI